MSPAEEDALKSYLRSLDKDELNLVLNEVLIEQRSRDSEQLKKDFLTHSKSLAMLPRQK